MVTNCGTAAPISTYANTSSQRQVLSLLCHSTLIRTSGWQSKAKTFFCILVKNNWKIIRLSVPAIHLQARTNGWPSKPYIQRFDKTCCCLHVWKIIYAISVTKMNKRVDSYGRNVVVLVRTWKHLFSQAYPSGQLAFVCSGAPIMKTSFSFCFLHLRIWASLHKVKCNKNVYCTF